MLFMSHQRSLSLGVVAQPTSHPSVYLRLQVLHQIADLWRQVDKHVTSKAEAARCGHLSATAI